MTKPHCIGGTTSVSNLGDITKAYKESFLKSHGEVDADDWKAFNDTVNDGFGKLDPLVPNINVDRPPDGPDFHKSEFYTDFLTPLSVSQSRSILVMPGPPTFTLVLYSDNIAGVGFTSANLRKTESGVKKSV